MKKSVLFIDAFVIGVILLALELAVFHIDGAGGLLLTLAGVYMIIGGAIGACVTSVTARRFFTGALHAVFAALGVGE
jgi:hypothetical protein